MRPSLPQNAPDPAARRARLSQAREKYRFAHIYADKSLPTGVAVAAEVPREDNFTPGYMAKVIATEGQLLRNHIASDLERIASGTVDISLGDILGLTRLVGNKNLMFDAPTRAAGTITKDFPVNLAGYQTQFATIKAPEVVAALDKTDPAYVDEVFAWQRLAGANPLILSGITKLPKRRTGLGAMLDHFKQDVESLFHSVPPAPPPGELPANFPLTNKIYQSVMGNGDSLEQAVAERRLYIANYRLLAGLPHGKWETGVLGVHRDKYTPAPIAAFAWRKPTRDKRGAFVPVAIQCGQDLPGTDGNPIFTPADGVRWKMAKTTVQVADGNAQEMVYHLGHAHLSMEAVIVSAMRNLAPDHPLLVLLKPHFEFTLTLNDYAVHHLIAPGGQVDDLFGFTLEGSLKLMTRGMEEFVFSRSNPVDDCEDRLVDDLAGLPEYPWRDDAATVFRPLQRFVRRYVDLYYANDEDVTKDTEVQAFFEALADPARGSLKGVVQPKTVKELQHAIATIVWMASAGHGCLNYAQFPMMGYVVNVPGALYAKPPTAHTPQNETNWLEMLPPLHRSSLQFNILYQLSNVHWGKLGHYPPLQFLDRRVAPLLTQLQKELGDAETEIEVRDQYRLLSYPWLKPSQLGNSIYI